MATFTPPDAADVLTMDRETIGPIALAYGIPVEGKIGDLRSAVLVAMVVRANAQPSAERDLDDDETDETDYGAVVLDVLTQVGATLEAVAAEVALSSKLSRAALLAATAPAAAPALAPAVAAAPPVAVSPSPGRSEGGAEIRLPDGHVAPPPGAFSKTERVQVNPPVSVEGGTARHMPDGWKPEEAQPAQFPDGAPKARPATPLLAVRDMLNELTELRDGWRRSLPAEHPARSGLMTRAQNAVGAMDTLQQFVATTALS